MKNTKIQLHSFEKLHKNFLKSSGYKKEYDNLEFEFEIIKALIQARAQKNLTQRELANKLGIAQSALARFESGRTNPTLSFLQKVTSGLGLKLKIE